MARRVVRSPQSKGHHSPEREFRLWERGYRDHGVLQLAYTARRIYDADGKEKVEQFGWWNLVSPPAVDDAGYRCWYRAQQAVAGLCFSFHLR